MADGRPEGISDAEWDAILAYRRDSAPKRKGSLRLPDAESGGEFEIELTVEEANEVAKRGLAKLLGGGDDKSGGGKGGDGDKKPTALKDYFGGGKKAASS